MGILTVLRLRIAAVAEAIYGGYTLCDRFKNAYFASVSNRYEVPIVGHLMYASQCSAVLILRHIRAVRILAIGARSNWTL